MNTSTSKTDRLISSYLKARNQQLGLTQADYMAALDRSQGYVSERLDRKRSKVPKQPTRPRFGGVFSYVTLDCGNRRLA